MVLAVTYMGRVIMSRLIPARYWPSECLFERAGQLPGMQIRRTLGEDRDPTRRWSGNLLGNAARGAAPQLKKWPKRRKYARFGLEGDLSLIHI